MIIQVSSSQKLYLINWTFTVVLSLQISLSAGTKPYVDRIHEVGEKDPVLLVAHSYTRYMGDLSGGQILKKVAQRALKLPSTGEGLNFYQFEGIHSHKGFKQLYRSRMNELELDAETKDRIVEESNQAFGFNMMVRKLLIGIIQCTAICKKVHCLKDKFKVNKYLILLFTKRYSQNLKSLERLSKRRSKMQGLDTVMQRWWRVEISTSVHIMQLKWVRNASPLLYLWNFVSCISFCR